MKKEIYTFLLNYSSFWFTVEDIRSKMGIELTVSTAMDVQQSLDELVEYKLVQNYTDPNGVSGYRCSNINIGAILW